MNQKAQDIFDELIVQKQIEENKPEKTKHAPITTGSRDLAAEFWFVLNAAIHPHFEIKKVVCIDLTDKFFKAYLTDLIVDMNS